MTEIYCLREAHWARVLKEKDNLLQLHGINIVPSGSSALNPSASLIGNSAFSEPGSVVRNREPAGPSNRSQPFLAGSSPIVSQRNSSLRAPHLSNTFELTNLQPCGHRSQHRRALGPSFGQAYPFNPSIANHVYPFNSGTANQVYPLNSSIANHVSVPGNLGSHVSSREQNHASRSVDHVLLPQNLGEATVVSEEENKHPKPRAVTVTAAGSPLCVPSQEALDSPGLQTSIDHDEASKQTNSRLQHLKLLTFKQKLRSLKRDQKEIDRLMEGRSNSKLAEARKEAKAESPKSSIEEVSSPGQTVSSPELLANAGMHPTFRSGRAASILGLDTDDEEDVKKTKRGRPSSPFPLLFGKSETFDNFHESKQTDELGSRNTTDKLSGLDSISPHRGRVPTAHAPQSVNTAVNVNQLLHSSDAAASNVLENPSFCFPVRVSSLETSHAIEHHQSPIFSEYGGTEGNTPKPPAKRLSSSNLEASIKEGDSRSLKRRKTTKKEQTP